MLAIVVASVLRTGGMVISDNEVRTLFGGHRKPFLLTMVEWAARQLSVDHKESY